VTPNDNRPTSGFAKQNAQLDVQTAQIKQQQTTVVKHAEQIKLMQTQMAALKETVCAMKPAAKICGKESKYGTTKDQPLKAIERSQSISESNQFTELNMKHSIQICLIILCVFLASCGGTSLVGIYKNADVSKDGFIEFTDDGHFTLFYKGDKPRRGTYQADIGKTPKTIDMALDITDASGNVKSVHSAGIFKVEGNKLTVKIANGTDTNALSPGDFKDSPAYFITQYERSSGPVPKGYQSE
jgi:uncharacterized protein (TIGR03067 family)